MVEIVQIGNGKAAKFHRENYPLNTKVVALVVRDVVKHQQLVRNDPTLPKDVLVTDEVGDVQSKFANVIWDVVSDDETHLDYVKKIVAVDNRAKIMLAKTPYNTSIIRPYQQILRQNPQVKISITENYAVSNVSIKLRELLAQYRLQPERIIIEFTKNRVKDIIEGRFIHPTLGVLGYEGSHILTILQTLDLALTEVKSAAFEDLVLPDGRVFKNHGSCLIEGRANGVRVTLFTSMIGKIKYPFEQLGVRGDIGYGDETRHRMVIVEDAQMRLVAQYDPVPEYERYFGRIVVLRNHQVIERIESIEDNTVRKILGRQICYLSGQGCEQPMSIDDAAKFSILEEIYNKFAN